MNIDLWSIGWHMLSVFFLALLFKHFLFKPVRAFMDNNAKKVMEDRQQLEVVKQEITIQQNQVKAQKEELRAHSAETLTRSQKQAEELAKDVIATAEKGQTEFAAAQPKRRSSCVSRPWRIPKSVSDLFPWSLPVVSSLVRSKKRIMSA